MNRHNNLGEFNYFCSCEHLTTPQTAGWEPPPHCGPDEESDLGWTPLLPAPPSPPCHEEMGVVGLAAGPPGSRCRSPGRTGAQRRRARSFSPPPETPECRIRDFIWNKKTYLLKWSSQRDTSSHDASYLLKGPRNDATLLVWFCRACHGEGLPRTGLPITHHSTWKTQKTLQTIQSRKSPKLDKILPSNTFLVAVNKYKTYRLTAM